MLRKLQGNRLRSGVAGGGVAFLPQSLALFARFTTPPSLARMVRINTLISALITAGVWAKLDAFYVTAQYDAQSAQQNWVQNLYNLTPTSSPTFTADRGYAGNGTSSYLATGALRNALSKFTQDSASIGAWERSEINAGLIVGTAAGAVARIQPRAGGLAGGRLNAASGASAAVVSSIGLTVMDRPSSSSVRALRNGVQINLNAVSTSAAPTADEFYLLRDASTFSAGQVASAYIGAAMTDGEHLAAYNAVNTYLIAVGAA
jgi:hypothetical protein